MTRPARLPRVLVALVAAACGHGAAPGRVGAQSCIAGTVADAFVAEAAGLSREWILQLPAIANGATVVHVVVGDGLVVVQTSDSTVYAIEAAPLGGSPAVGRPLPGSLLWARRLDDAGGPVTRAGIGKDTIAVAFNMGVTALERETGHIRWRESLGRSESSGTAVIGSWIYLAAMNDTMWRLAADPLRQPTEVDDEVEPTPPKGRAAKKPAKPKKKRKESLEPIAMTVEGEVRFTPRPLGKGVVWCTTDGDLSTLQPAALEWIRLDYALQNTPAGPPAVSNRGIFAATQQGDLARIDLPPSLKKLQLVWHTVLPTPAVAGPFVGDDTVVVSLGDRGIAAYAAETGSQLWIAPVSGRLITVGGGRAWFVDAIGKLAALDLVDGTVRARLCLGPFTVPVVNAVSDRILLASPSGMVVSLAPRGPAGIPEPAPAPVNGPAVPEPGTSDPDATPRP